jgi:hypothetical protein
LEATSTTDPASSSAVRPHAGWRGLASNSNRDPPTQAAVTVATEDGFKSTTSVLLGLNVTDDVHGGEKELPDLGQFELQ